MQILDVKIDNLSRLEAVVAVEKFLTDGQQHLITTPNPEIILAARADKEFKNILNQADLNLPDGFGLILASYLLGQPLKQQICGSDFIFDLAALAEKENKKIFLLGGEDEIAKRAGETLLKKFPRLQIVGAEQGIQPLTTHYSLQTNPAMNETLLIRINAVQPDILLVAFGQIKQEKWLAQNLAKMPSVKVAMGVGGTFDFLAGKIARAPLFLRQIGLEWLWRLLKEPKRAKRIFRAVIQFPVLVIFSLFKKTA
ncbi:MAG: WecB/TagA/CpsF family glycosyltransferase [bacterium]|nr:WecB/TagA/CpsF family glycosyltransferase [bacterium]